MILYRPNVAALMVDTNGNLLICERSTIPGAWQFPQGGVDLGEEIEQALYREIREEIGLSKEHYEIIRSKGDDPKRLPKNPNSGNQSDLPLQSLPGSKKPFCRLLVSIHADGQQAGPTGRTQGSGS